MKRTFTLLGIIGMAVYAAACSSGTAPGSNVAIAFRTSGAFATAGALAAPGASLGSAAVQDLVVDGTNGRLTISDLRVIVEELELEPVETGECDDDVVAVECPDFHQRYLFVQVPVDGSDVQVAVTDATGVFDELDLKVDDAEVDSEDAGEIADAQLIQDMFDHQILPAFPDWPARASMVVVGTFEPKNPDGTFGDPVPFTTYFRAEIEVEMTLSPPFDSATDTQIAVTLDPAAWFQRQDGTVMDLSALQDQLVEFEAEMEHGIEAEIDD